MPSVMPSPATVRAAIDIYVRCAYDAAIPPAVGVRLQTLQALSDALFFESSLFEKENTQIPTRYSLRLGNRLYPHMKLTLQKSPDGSTFLFKADTHDTHCCPDPKHSEYEAFVRLMDVNQKIAQQIETRWAEAGIPTFKTYLRDDLMRRQAAAGK